MSETRVHVLAQLYWAAHNDDVTTLKQLLENDDSSGLLNVMDYDHRTPLHVAASTNSLTAAQLLLSAGAEVNALDRWHNTPLDNAQSANSTPMVKLLEKYGALSLPKHEEDGTKNQHFLPPKPQPWDSEIDPQEIDLRTSVLIGKGSFGEIYKALWRGTPVAVKMIRSSLSNDYLVVGDFIYEVELLLTLRHPNIVQFLGAVIKQVPLMLVTEYLPGGDVHEVLQKGPMPAALAVGFAMDMARGMAYLHSPPNVIIHRDLKPHNLILDEGGELKVGDFGLSKLIHVDHLHEVYKLTGETGSYRYMAPEVFKHQPYDAKVDVFSFAMILYEMLEGVAPFHNMDAYEAASSVAEDDRRPKFGPKTHYPNGMKDLITKCWEFHATKRPSFEEIVILLEDIQENLPQPAHCFSHLLHLHLHHRHHHEKVSPLPSP